MTLLERAYSSLSRAMHLAYAGELDRATERTNAAQGFLQPEVRDLHVLFNNEVVVELLRTAHSERLCGAHRAQCASLKPISVGMSAVSYAHLNINNSTFRVRSLPAECATDLCNKIFLRLKQSYNINALISLKRNPPLGTNQLKCSLLC